MILSIEEITVLFGRIPAVQGLSLEVSEGEVIGVIGPNGAGKSTTLSAVMGLLRPSRGAISFDGRRVDGLAPEQIARQGVQLVPEGRQIFQTLTVAENLLLGTSTRRKSTSKEDTNSVLDRFPALAEYLNTSAGKLSGGQQQQLAIARALLARPRLLMLDEPSLGLAPKVIDLVFQTLAELRDEGVTILLVEQNAHRTIAFADRTYVLRSGSVALTGSREQLMGSERVVETYLGVGRS